MDSIYLRSSFINSVCGNIILHRTSIAYLDFLIGSLLSRNWNELMWDILNCFPNSYAERVRLSTAKIDYDSCMNLDVYYKQTLISVLSELIIRRATKIARDNHDTFILPWDIQKVIRKSSLAKIFQVSRDDKRGLLPVTVVVNTSQYTWSFSLEHTIGLLTFSSLFMENCPYHIVMFNVTFTPDYIARELFDKYYSSSTEDSEEDYIDFDNTVNSHSRFGVNHNHLYSVEIHSKLLYFNDAQFIHGFTRGAELVHVDPLPYYKDFILMPIDY